MYNSEYNYIIRGEIKLYSKNKHEVIIKDSHERCIKYGLTRNYIDSDIPISKEDLERKLQLNSNFIDIATPFINGLYEFLNDTGYYIMLSDMEGCVLYLKGDAEDLEEAKNNHIEVGRYKNEQIAGTNGIGTALYEDLPVQITGKEHFLTYNHLWTCSGAPIHDENGKIIGSLNLTGKVEKVHEHTLGLVVAAVASIENELKVKKAHSQLYSAYYQINKLINSIKKGIISVNRQGYIENVNNKFCEIYGKGKEEIQNIRVDNLIEQWEDIVTECKKTHEDINREIYFKSNKNKIYNADIYAIRDDEDIIQEYIIIIDEVKNIYNIVGKYSGFQSKYSFEDIIGSSYAIEKLKKECEIVSESSTTVLIHGESGTGKELFAQAIHNASSRRNKPFIEINCAAIPNSLIESELFGYEEGAFTGARKKGHPGKFELSNGGTIFLDEIGEMPIDMQAKLLRVIQERTVVRIGGDRRIPVDIRIIAATNRDLKKEIKENNFREDLYYRLNVFSINIPPLRERVEDIELIAKHFIYKFNSRLNKNIKNINKEALEILNSYFWPGNIRELENVIERIANLSTDTEIGVEDLPNYLIQNYKELYKDNNIKNQGKLIDSEMREIINVLKKNGGNLKESSKVLGIGRSTLYRKLKKYNIDYEIFRE